MITAKEAILKAAGKCYLTGYDESLPDEHIKHLLDEVNDVLSLYFDKDNFSFMRDARDIAPTAQSVTVGSSTDPIKSVIDVTSGLANIAAVHMNEVDFNATNFKNVTSTVPTAYHWSRVGSDQVVINLWPTPAKGTEVHLILRKHLKRMTDINDIIPFLPDDAETALTTHLAVAVASRERLGITDDLRIKAAQVQKKFERDYAETKVMVRTFSKRGLGRKR